MQPTMHWGVAAAAGAARLGKLDGHRGRAAIHTLPRRRGHTTCGAATGPTRVRGGHAAPGAAGAMHRRGASTQ
eukprot:10749324-Alexandrium_andersonii.AAC.1